jgi:TolB-like protein/Tfp pilus assembly protein PilF
VAEASHAIFLSYASQDAEAARRICEALRAAGIEVWFDQSALRGGDVWDQTIRKQIKTCVLFIPVISRHTHERDEGYFRLEWKLAVDRSHLMTTNKAFLLPVVVDDTREDDENVPDRFKDIHWTRLPGGETPPAFVERVRRLVSPEPHGPTTIASPAGPVSTASLPVGATLTRPKRALLAVVSVVILGVVAYFAVDKLSKRPSLLPSAPAAPARVAQAEFAPPPHSIAVLPFVNMSGDKEQDYFSDGLTEEILNSLARINELQVSARTSSFSFKGTNMDLGAIAHKLNVGSVLEGSVRRAGNTVRITAQLNNAVTGFHLWSQTYDRNLSDVLQLQTEIANAVASALKVTLLGDVAAKIELGGTRNPEAFDAYLRATNAFYGSQHETDQALIAKDHQTVIANYTEAIRLDPDYALAYADRSIALYDYASDPAFSLEPALRPDYLNRAQADARKAIALTPDLGEGHLALGLLLQKSLDFTGAIQEIELARRLAPGNARVLRDYAIFAVTMGKIEAGVASAERALALDPLSANNHFNLGMSLFAARRFDEALKVFKREKAMDPNDTDADVWLGFTYYWSGDLQSARTTCEVMQADNPGRSFCLAVTYNKLGRHAEAETMLGQYRTLTRDQAAVFYAMIYSDWGKNGRALDWLETGVRRQDPYLNWVRTWMFDPLRKEPRFQAVMRELKFPTE